MVDFAKLRRQRQQSAHPQNSGNSMSNHSEVSPAQKKLMQQAGAWNQARTQKNPFKNKLAVPDGDYYGRVKKAKLTLTQAKDPMATIVIVVICDTDGRVVDDEGMTMAGEQARLMHTFKPTEKQTLADKFARFCYDLQALNYDTSQLGIEEVEGALSQVEEDAKYCVLNVKTSDDGQKQFVNVNEETTLDVINEALAAAGNDQLTDEEAGAGGEDTDASGGDGGEGGDAGVAGEMGDEGGEGEGESSDDGSAEDGTEGGEGEADEGAAEEPAEETPPPPPVKKVPPAPVKKVPPKPASTPPAPVTPPKAPVKKIPPRPPVKKPPVKK